MRQLTVNNWGMKIRIRTGAASATQVAVLGGVLMTETIGMVTVRDRISQVAPTALFLLIVMIAGLVSNWRVAAAVAVVSGALLNWYFMVPFGTLKIHQFEDVAGFIAFSVTSGAIVLVIGAWNRGRVETASARRSAFEAEERAERRRAQILWLSQVSHDIRTPLSTVRAVVGDLREGVKYSEETMSELLEVAVDEIDRLDRLVGNWLMLGSLDHRREGRPMVAVDLGEVLTDSIRRLAPVLRTNSVETSIEPDLPPIDGDFVELQHLVMNVIVNAQRHSPPGEPIEIHVYSDGSQCVMTVRDCGQGFADGETERLLEPFVTGGSRGSTGLGLAICSRVADLHGGDLRLSNATPKGAVVEVRLPVRSPRSGR